MFHSLPKLCFFNQFRDEDSQNYIKITRNQYKVKLNLHDTLQSFLSPRFMSVAPRFKQKLDHWTTSDFKPINSNLKQSNDLFIKKQSDDSGSQWPFVITSTIVRINIYWHLIEIALAVAGNPKWAAGQFVEEGLCKQRSLYSKRRSKSLCGEERREMGKGKEEVREMLADGQKTDLQSCL